MDFAEVLQAFEAGLGGLELHRVEHVAGLERNFAADDLVLGLGVAGDVDTANLETGAFVDAVDDVDAVGSGVADVGAHGGIGVSTRSIVAADHLDVLAHLLGVVGAFAGEGERGLEFLGLEHRHFSKADSGDGVFLTLVDWDDQVDAAILDRFAAHAGAVGAEVAFAAVVIEHRVEVGVELVGLEAARFREP